MLSAIGALTILGLTLGSLLGFAARVLRVEGDPLADEIEAMMPGTNCGQCGHPGCSAAAVALSSGEAGVTLCPPGGAALAEALAQKLGVALDLSASSQQQPLLAQIHEESCIGCKRCYKLCPTDAIVGGPKMIHAVIQDACTGCGKCVDICPTESPVLTPAPITLQTWSWPKPMVEAPL